MRTSTLDLWGEKKMLNYIRADLHRILRRVPRIVILVLMYLITLAVVMNDAVSKNMNSIGFMADISSVFSITCVFLGMVEIMAVFADDFRAKTMQVAIGLGVSRPLVVLAKAIEFLLLALLDAFLLSALLLLGSTALGITLNGDDVYQLVIRAIFAALNMLIPALFTMIPVFWLQGTGLAVILFLVFYIDPLAQILGLFLATNELVVDLHLNEIPYSTLLGAAATRMTLHTGFPLVQFLGLAIYIVAAFLLTVLVFRKRELEF